MVCRLEGGWLVRLALGWLARHALERAHYCSRPWHVNLCFKTIIQVVVSQSHHDCKYWIHMHTVCRWLLYQSYSIVCRLLQVKDQSFICETLLKICLAKAVTKHQKKHLSVNPYSIDYFVCAGSSSLIVERACFNLWQSLP